ncbi:MAG: S1 RNA-binding domain-containing protein, partial [Deltaproteobacteria bacterium]|nr:S1 RNA-binding domain-containing protein [Deltaproteobacteria bacterium]
VEDCVNAVGVDVNTASAPLLARVSGLNHVVANNIVEYRNVNGPFRSRKVIRKVPRLGDKTFEQAAGFLRINDGDNPLDRSAVHPEAYPVVERILLRIGKGIGEVMGQPAALKELSAAEFTDEKFGVPTVRDILLELEKPGRDPRPEFKTATFHEGIESISDLQPNIILEGVVTNVAAFGAFVDIGVHQDGLIHVSAMANRFVKDPHEIVKPGQIVKVKVMEVDLKRQRISLTMRLDGAPSSVSRAGDTRVEANANAEASPRERRPYGTNRDKPQVTGAIALALERAKLKK